MNLFCDLTHYRPTENQVICRKFWAGMWHRSQCKAQKMQVIVPGAWIAFDELPYHRFYRSVRPFYVTMTLKMPCRWQPRFYSKFVFDFCEYFQNKATVAVAWDSWRKTKYWKNAMSLVATVSARKFLNAIQWTYFVTWHCSSSTYLLPRFETGNWPPSTSITNDENGN